MLGFLLGSAVVPGARDRHRRGRVLGCRARRRAPAGDAALVDRLRPVPRSRRRGRDPVLQPAAACLSPRGPSSTSRAASSCERCEVARSFRARSRGLLGRKGLEPGGGMLITKTSSIHTFFMAFRSTRCSSTGTCASAGSCQDLRPLRIAWKRGSKSVLELPAGEAEAAGIEVGSRLLWHDLTVMTPSRRPTISSEARAEMLDQRAALGHGCAQHARRPARAGAPRARGRRRRLRRAARPAARRRRRGRPRPARGPARDREDADGRRDRPRARRQLQARPVHAGHARPRRSPAAT